MQDKEGENKYDSSGSSLNAFIHKKNKKTNRAYSTQVEAWRETAMISTHALTRTQRPQHTILVVE